MILDIYWWGGGGLIVKILLGMLIVGVAWVCFFPDSLVTAYSRFKFWILDLFGSHPAKKK